MTIQGAKSEQEEATERACRSPTLLNEVNASKRATLRVIIFSDTELNGHKGSNGASSSAPRTIQRCQEGICGQQPSGTAKEPIYQGVPPNRSSIQRFMAGGNSGHKDLQSSRGQLKSTFGGTPALYRPGSQLGSSGIAHTTTQRVAISRHMIL